MLSRSLILGAFLLTALGACRPKPIEIPVKQLPGSLAVSSICLDARTVYVSAGYSISSLKKLLDTTAAGSLPDLPKEMLVDSGLVTIKANGSAPDTLRRIAPGLYGSKSLNLVPGMPYSLLVADYRKGRHATATTTYMPAPEIDTLYPERVPSGQGSLVKLRLRLGHCSPGSYFFVSYNTPRQLRETSRPLPYQVGALYSFVPKQLELFSVNEAHADQSLTLQVAAQDTVFVQLGQIDKAYYDYLAAYKRTGTLINQLTAEPINLPANINPGFGYFSLYQPQRRVYDLNRY